MKWRSFTADLGAVPQTIGLHKCIFITNGLYTEILKAHVVYFIDPVTVSKPTSRKRTIIIISLAALQRHVVLRQLRFGSALWFHMPLHSLITCYTIDIAIVNL